MSALRTVILLLLLGTTAAWGGSEEILGRPQLRVADREVRNPSPETINGMVTKIRAYALMSELAYRNYSSGQPLAEQARSESGESAKDLLARRERAKRWVEMENWLLKQWEFRGNSKISCASGEVQGSGGPTKAKQRENLEFDIWTNRSTVPPQVVVAFRGIDDGGDWLSDARGVYPEHRSDDQYAKLHEQSIREKVADACRYAGPGAIVTTTGHSLGGGLAQHLFYASRAWPANNVATSVVFDASPMTGWHQFGKAEERAKAMSNFNGTLAATLKHWKYPEVMADQYGFGTIRVNERGGVLSHVRSLSLTFEPEDPFMAVLNFDFENGNVLKQQSMSDLAYNLLHFPSKAPVPLRAETAPRDNVVKDPLLEVLLASP